MSIKKFSEHEDEYIDELLIELKNKTYKPSGETFISRRKTANSDRWYTNYQR